MAGSTIYVSGNPELYPLEYYDSADNAFEGAIPEMLGDFAEKSGYEIIYYEADGKDHRERHFENMQTDVISGVGGDYQPAGETVTVFETEQGGETVSYGITFTESAPEGFIKDLKKYFEGISESEKTGLLMEVTNAEREARRMDQGMIAAVALLFAVAVLLGILLYRYRRRAHRTEFRLRHDDATGLGNRDYLEKYYGQLVNDHNRVMYYVYYFWIDTERAARIGGRSEAEEAVRYAGDVLNEYAGDQDILARVSQEGIVLFKLTGKHGESGAWIHAAAEKIRAYSEQHGRTYSINAWAGVYPLRQSDKNLDSILANAEQTARMASRQNVDFRICSDEVLEQFREEKMIEGDIERAFENREFQMYVQFYVETHSGEVCGAEALTRWLHPAKGLLTPGTFIPVLERTGHIRKLDFLMLERVCAFLERNFGREGSGFFLSCNFSRTSFTAPDFVERCREIIEKHDFNINLLTFELTESPDPGDAEQIRKNAEQMKEYGVRLALDDFGEGYTSFKDLLHYPIDIVKLDRSLTDTVTEDKARKILGALIRAEHEVSVKCLAEGVEEEETLAVLKELSCDAVQGYMFYYPLPEPEAEQILKEEYERHREKEVQKTVPVPKRVRKKTTAAQIGRQRLPYRVKALLAAWQTGTDRRKRKSKLRHISNT